MPRGDGTGPWGRGPLTGGGFGWCGAGRMFGRGYGGFGGYGVARGGRMRVGPGYFGGYYDEPAEDEKSLLTEEAAFLKQRLKALEERIGQIDKQDDK